MFLDISKRNFFFFSAAMLSPINFVKFAYAQAFVEESQPQAAALGYKSDASRVDQAKYAKFSPGQSCSSCALYQGAPGSISGGCALFAGKYVSSGGWCWAYAKKVGSPIPAPPRQPDIPTAPEKPQIPPASTTASPQPSKVVTSGDKAVKKCTRLGLTPGSDDYKLCLKSM